jgi:hypothetical protein
MTNFEDFVCRIWVGLLSTCSSILCYVHQSDRLIIMLYICNTVMSVSFKAVIQNLILSRCTTCCVFDVRTLVVLPL